jgi:hypothetical protein
LPIVSLALGNEEEWKIVFYEPMFTFLRTSVLFIFLGLHVFALQHSS